MAAATSTRTGEILSISDMGIPLGLVTAIRFMITGTHTLVMEDYTTTTTRTMVSTRITAMASDMECTRVTTMDGVDIMAVIMAVTMADITEADGLITPTGRIQLHMEDVKGQAQCRRATTQGLA